MSKLTLRGVFFVTRSSVRLNIWALCQQTRYMQKFAKKYNVPGLHPHKLRHTFASIAITNGADVASVSEKLGHSDKAITLRMYTHADKESMKRASQIFRDALKKAGQS